MRRCAARRQGDDAGARGVRRFEPWAVVVGARRRVVTDTTTPDSAGTHVAPGWDARLRVPLRPSEVPHGCHHRRPRRTPPSSQRESRPGLSARRARGSRRRGHDPLRERRRGPCPGHRGLLRPRPPLSSVCRSPTAARRCCRSRSAKRSRRRATGGHVTAGGQFATLARAWLLERYAWLDSVVRFAGEVPVVALARRVSAAEPVADVPGVTTRAGDGPPAPVLDLAPMTLRPSRDRLPEDPRSSGGPHRRVPGLYWALPVLRSGGASRPGTQ